MPGYRFRLVSYRTVTYMDQMETGGLSNDASKDSLPALPLGQSSQPLYLSERPRLPCRPKGVPLHLCSSKRKYISTSWVFFNCLTNARAHLRHRLQSWRTQYWLHPKSLMGIGIPQRVETSDGPNEAKLSITVPHRTSSRFMASGLSHPCSGIRYCRCPCTS